MASFVYENIGSKMSSSGEVLLTKKREWVWETKTSNPHVPGTRSQASVP